MPSPGGPRIITPAEVPGLLAPGMTVYVAGGANEPLPLIEAIRDDPQGGRGVRFIQSIVPGLNRTDFCALHPEARTLAFFVTPETRASHEAGRVDFVPLQLREVTEFLRESCPLDAALIGVARAGDGSYSSGLNADFLDAVLERARVVIAEVNARMPAPPDAPAVPGAALDFVVETDRPLAPMPLPPETEAARAIGRRVAGLVRDGDCIQTGIGSIPYAVLAALDGHNDLGLHSGIIDDAVRALIERGNITGRRKTLERGRHVAAIAMGTEALYEWLGSAPGVSFRHVSHTHDARVLAALESFVSINSAIEIDFQGQVNAEMIGPRQVAGTGGSVDFMRGAAASRGGRSIIALTATAAGGRVSRIVPRLAPGSVPTALRTDIDWVVTEHGAARLRHLSLPARADALIELAAPEHRDGLRAARRELFAG